jgi:DUF4097 and DUF4098 domain-containing protein YvlB
MDIAVRSKKEYGPLLVVPVVALLAGCDVRLGNLSARATDEWTRSYALAPGGEIRVANTNGRIDVEGIDGSSVEVRAERIARAATDSAARELLPKITIKEEATHERVSLETERISGILIGTAYEVRYHVRAPKNAVVDVTNTNGQVALTGLAGRVSARTTNGGVKGEGLSGGIDARSTNGVVSIDLASVGSEPVSLRTTNGGVMLTLPESAKADLSASVTNGGIRVDDFQNLDVSERSRRRLEAKLNGGGTPIELHTTNGGVRVRPRNGGVDADKDERRDR